MLDAKPEPASPVTAIARHGMLAATMRKHARGLSHCSTTPLSSASSVKAAAISAHV